MKSMVKIQNHKKRKGVDSFCFDLRRSIKKTFIPTRSFDTFNLHVELFKFPTNHQRRILRFFLRKKVLFILGYNDLNLVWIFRSVNANLLTISALLRMKCRWIHLMCPKDGRRGHNLYMSSPAMKWFLDLILSELISKFLNSYFRET